MPTPSDRDPELVGKNEHYTTARRNRLLEALAEQTLVQAYQRPDLRADLEAEAADNSVPDEMKIVRSAALEIIRQAASPPPAAARFELFNSKHKVILVPGFLGSQLDDVFGDRTHWISGWSVIRDRLSALRLTSFADGANEDADRNVSIQPVGAIEMIYGPLHAYLEITRCDVREFPVDWRKDLEIASARLRDFVNTQIAEDSNPIHLVAHSQGAMVARRGLQLLRDAIGEDAVRERVKSMILLGPANRGSFASAATFAGVHTFLQKAARVLIDPGEGFAELMQSMSGLYQLLPWDSTRLPDLAKAAYDLGKPAFWTPTGIDAQRLDAYFGWAEGIEDVLADRTTVILGDALTASGVVFHGGKLKISHVGAGDGTVPDPCAAIDGANHVRLNDSSHMLLPAYQSAMRAIRRVIGGEPVGLTPVSFAEAIRPPRKLGVPVDFEAFERAPPGQFGMAARPAQAFALDQEPQQKTPTVESTRAPSTAAPPARRLRVFGFDPSLSVAMETRELNRMTLSIPWEANAETGVSVVAPGPVGEYLEVIDYDPSSQRFYPPVDLNHPHLLAQDGLTPSEADPQFHQQMTYAVAMNTIAVFEKALGRPVVWSKRIVKSEGKTRSEYVQRLRIHPHALREANAYYSSDKKALLFGYFQANSDDYGRNAGIPPGGVVFTCLSQEIIAHETTHAILDGLHRYFMYDSNPDVLAFHEAFADIVALFQHFSHAEVVRDQIGRSRGDMRTDNLLGKLAVQFGKAVGNRSALREYIGRVEPDGVWRPAKPDPGEFAKTHEPHARGAILVAAIFDAFLTIYEHRTSDLMRIGRRLEGVQPDWHLHPDLTGRLADEAAKAAKHVLQMCVRAVDYLPCVDVTFGEYLRAIVTADQALVPDDDLGYRIALIDAFRRRGLFAEGVRSLSEEALLWQGPAEGFELTPDQTAVLGTLESVVGSARRDRRRMMEDRERDAKRLHAFVAELPEKFDQVLGIQRGPRALPSIRHDQSEPKFQIHTVRAARRVGPDGQSLPELFFEVVQRRRGYFDANVQKQVDEGVLAPPSADFEFRGGCTLIVDLITGRIRYSIVKDISSSARLNAERVRRRANGRSGFVESENEPFAVMHRDLAGEHAHG